MRVAIIGAGPIGQILAAAHLKKNDDVLVVERSNVRRREFARLGIRTRGLAEGIFHSFEQAADLGAFHAFAPDLVWVATKATANEGLAIELARTDRPGRLYGVAQNGLGVEAAFVRAFSAERTLRLVLMVAAHPLADGTIFGQAMAPSVVAALADTHHGDAARLAERLTNGGFACNADPDWRVAVWRKALLNTIFNSICALGQCVVNDMIHCRTARRLAEGLVEEGRAVARAEGIELEADVLDEVWFLMGQAGTHPPSMVEDVKNKRPTEARFLSGYIAATGARLGVATPLNADVTRLLEQAGAGSLPDANGLSSRLLSDDADAQKADCAFCLLHYVAYGDTRCSCGHAPASQQS